MDYRRLILASVKGQPPLNSGAFGTIYPLEGDLVAKLFHRWDKDDARREFENLQQMFSLDPRIRVPEPHALVELGATDFPPFSPGYRVRPSAVVMERIYGRPLDEMCQIKSRGKYLPALRKLLEALREHRWYSLDLKRDHLLCMDGCAHVCLVDTHDMSMKTPREDVGVDRVLRMYYARRLRDYRRSLA